MDNFDTEIQCDECIPALYEMTPEEYAEFCKEYNEWLDKHQGYRPEKEYA